MFFWGILIGIGLLEEWVLNFDLMVFVDVYIKFLEVVKMINIMVKVIVNMLCDIFSRYGFFVFDNVL